MQAGQKRLSRPACLVFSFFCPSCTLNKTHDLKHFRGHLSAGEGLGQILVQSLQQAKVARIPVVEVNGQDLDRLVDVDVWCARTAADILEDRQHFAFDSLCNMFKYLWIYESCAAGWTET